MKYLTQINEQSYEIEIDSTGAVLVNGEARDVDFLNLGGSLFSVITQNKSLEAVIDDEDGGIAVMMGGRLYAVQVLDERATLLLQRRGGKVESTGEIRAPMPGLIVAVSAERGQDITQGTALVILESMKMQNELLAPISGTVSAVHVQAGQAVEKNTLLVELQPPPSD